METRGKTKLFPRGKRHSLFCYIAIETTKRRKRVNSDLDSFCKFFGDYSSAETIRNTKGDVILFLVTFCVFAESFPSIRYRISPR